MDDIYRDNILDHFRNPRNFGKLKNPDTGLKKGNPFCGDELSVSLIFKKNPNNSSPEKAARKIDKIAFSGRGCTISIASASMLSQQVVGKKVSQVLKLTGRDIRKMLNVELSATRLKCALLSLETLHQALLQYLSG